MARQDHVIICGYGRSGQNLARLLEARGHPLRRARRRSAARARGGGRGQSASSTATRRGARRWSPPGVAKARAVVVTFADTAGRAAHPAPRAAGAARAAGGRAHRRRQPTLDRLMAAGATEVVPEVLEGSLMLASHSLLLLGRAAQPRAARIRAIREERYSLFRGFFHGATDAADAADNLQPRLHSVAAPGARARGRPHAGRARARRCRRGDRRAAAGHALAASGCRLAVRGAATWSCCSACRKTWRSPSAGCSRADTGAQHPPTARGAAREFPAAAAVLPALARPVVAGSSPGPADN